MTRGLREREGLKVTLALSETLELGQVLRAPPGWLGRAVRFDEAAVLIKAATDGHDREPGRARQGRSRRIVPGPPTWRKR